ncbi:adenosine deaminase [Corallincola luteus]|uniref:Adenine deaminase n=1 Tax=Corallincola luteus TaxID=1775177 RepID=A0ABY2APD9_9GAMM|nr:adenosine deaminase [Corallincola luteus]TCI03621.1 adenosine deaminase [Corallincola luteus]
MDFATLKQLPKAELHLHIEGTLEPEMLFQLADKNQVVLPYADIDAVRAAYQFNSLQDFLDLYYQGMSVLQTASDFYDLTWAYLERCQADGVVHTEIFFDPQGHTVRGIAIDVVIDGISRAIAQAHTRLGLSASLIPCFLRHLSEQDALDTWQELQPHLAHFVAVGLDSSELGHPPEKFERVFALVRDAGLKVVAHAGEEGPAAYILGALDSLKANRIDHGVRCLEDKALVDRLVAEQIPLTVCPFSNIKLKVFADLASSNLQALLDAGLCVTINSDDPAYFGGYINDNILQVAAAQQLNDEQIRVLLGNSFKASFLPEEQKQAFLQQLAEC